MEPEDEGASEPETELESLSSSMASSSGGGAARRLWAADRLWPWPLRALVREPKRTAVAWAVVNGAFVGTGELIAGLCWLLTTPGFFAGLAFGIYALVYNVARAITYPGFLRNVRRSLEKEIAREMRRSVERCLRLYVPFINVLGQMWLNQHLVKSNRVRLQFAALRARVDEGRRTVLEPLLRTLVHLRETQPDNTPLPYGGEELCAALEALLIADDLFVDMVVTPGLASLEQAGVQGFVRVFGPSIEALSFDLAQLCEDSVLKMHPRRGGKWEPDAAALRDALAREPGPLLEHLIHFLRLSTELSAHLQEHQAPAIGYAELIRGEGPDVDKQTGEGDPLGPEEIALQIEEAADEGPAAEEEDSGGVGKGGLMRTARTLLADYQSARTPLRAVASIDFMRADLEQRFGGQQAFVVMSDGTRIDTMLVPGAREGENVPPGGWADKRTVLVCNPNCGIYEFALFQCQWVGFYTRQGINVLVYNYRGYGRSQGWPSPPKLRRDGEELLDYLVREHGVQPGYLGVHAESIGGIVASHLASRGAQWGLTYLVADRTFCDLPTTANNMVGNWAGNVMRKLGWQADNVDRFLCAPAETACLCTCDPSDEIIANQASLKAGIARRLVRLACSPLGDSEEAPLLALARERLGPPEALMPWAPDLLFYERFGMACVRLAELQRSPAAAASAGVPLRLARELQEVIKVVWFTDGSCACCLGNPLSEFYGYWKRDRAAAPNAPEPFAASEDPAVAEERASALLDWFHCMLAWARDAPPLSDIVDASGARKGYYSLSGERGPCTPQTPVPLATTVRLLGRFREQWQGALQSADLGVTLQTVHEGLAAALAAIEARPAAPSWPASKLSLLPLNCGHNGRMNHLEEAHVLKHLRAAGWLQPAP